MEWPVQVVGTTGSTNVDLALRARAGECGPVVLAAREQTAGRGRLGRRWHSPADASLAVSVLWSPPVPQAAWTWLPMVVGLGVLDALASLGVAARLKWPNDVVVEDPPHEHRGAAPDLAGPSSGGAGPGALGGLAKLAGILVDVVAGPTGPVAVAGVGVNLLPPELPPGDDPPPRATSLSQLVDAGAGPGDGASFDRVLPALVAGLGRRLTVWGADPDDPSLRADYVAACCTLGRRVRVSTPGGAHDGVAVDVDRTGALVLDTGTDGGSDRRPGGGPGRVTVSAGDVEHVR